MLFENIIGQDKVKKELIYSVNSGRLGHALLFSGKNGYGTLALALAFSQYILCTGDKRNDSCNHCASCHKMHKIIHPDLNFSFPIIKAKATSVSDDFLAEWRTFLSDKPYAGLQEWAESIGVEGKSMIIPVKESHNIIHKLNFKSVESDYKIMLIWQPERMNTEASNSLLKILEEPHEKTLFILVSENPNKLLPTIKSRVQEIKINPISATDIKEYLIQKKGLEENLASSYSHTSGGDLERALHLIESPEMAKYNQEQFINIMRLCWNRNMIAVNSWVDDITKLSIEPQKNFLHHSLRMLRENFMLRFRENKLIYMTDKEREFSVKFSPYITEKNIIHLQQEFERAYKDLSANVNPTIVFTDLCIKVMQNIRP